MELQKVLNVPTGPKVVDDGVRPWNTEIRGNPAIDLSELTHNVWDCWMARKTGRDVYLNLDTVRKLYDYIKKDLLKNGHNTRCEKVGRKEYIVWVG